ncbi:hypothetical protein E4T49_05728 [Aureobasidium sp. EXF-10728]|nr:hypothetical protein E4T49_05728 [Aureobasidium sp. EXF-10728]
MRSSFFAVAAAVAAVNAQGAQPAPSSTVVADPGTLPLGADCARTEQCAGGAQCYASNSMQITQCGKYNAECDNDSQCATNFCAGGLCSGPLPQSEWLMPTSLIYNPSSTASSAVVSSTSSAGGIQPAPSSTVVAAAGSLPLGAECANTEQCAGGAECFASTAWLIKSCGKFNAACSNDSQCATNTCNNGLCNGFLASSAYLANTASSTASGMMSIMPVSTGSASSGAKIALGKSCNATSQCANGAECTVSSAYQEASAGKVCGPFNATCTDSSQCSYNSCFNSRCIGVVGYEYATSTAVVSGKPTLIAVNGSSVGTAGATGAVKTMAPASSVVAYTGGAAHAGVVSGVGAAVMGVVAFLL